MVADIREKSDTVEERKAFLRHRRGTRWMHWINFPLLTIMIWSGLRVYWANRVYAFGVGPFTIFKFFPDRVYSSFDLDRRLARGLAFHLSFAWLFVANALAYAVYTWRTGEWRKLVPDTQALRDVPKVVLHDLRLRSEAPPRGRYNAMQQLTYSAILIAGALVVVTGFVLYKPTQLGFLTTLFGGYQSARLIHFTCTIGFVGFFVVHIIQVMRAGTANLMAMITGYELMPDRDDDA